MKPIVTKKTFKKGDIVYLQDMNGEKYHPCLILNDDYESSLSYHGHGKLYNYLKLSLSKSKEYSIPIMNGNTISYICPHNIYAADKQYISNGRYYSSIDQHDILFILRISFMLISGIKDERLILEYNKYIQEFENLYGKLKDDYHKDKENNINKSIDIINENLTTNSIINDLTSKDVKSKIEENLNLKNSELLNNVILKATTIINNNGTNFLRPLGWLSKWSDFSLYLYIVIYHYDRKLCSKLYDVQNSTSKYEKIKSEILKRNL